MCLLLGNPVHEDALFAHAYAAASNDHIKGLAPLVQCSTACACVKKLGHYLQGRQELKVDLFNDKMMNSQ